MIHNYFSTPVLSLDKQEWLKDINKFCKPHIKEAKDRVKKETSNKTFGLSYHSHTLLGDANLKFFHDAVGQMSYDFLETIGHDLTNYTVFFTESWVQEFNEKGGGHHSGHIHSNNHISGFYFLEVEEGSSQPNFYDPRQARVMMHLPEKDSKQLSYVNEKIHYKPTAGQLIIFPAYLTHEFAVQDKAKFRFIHFNAVAINNSYTGMKNELQEK